jgi:hypothetical protein
MSVNIYWTTWPYNTESSNLSYSLLWESRIQYHIHLYMMKKGRSVIHICIALLCTQQFPSLLCALDKFLFYAQNSVGKEQSQCSVVSNWDVDPWHLICQVLSSPMTRISLVVYFLLFPRFTQNLNCIKYSALYCSLISLKTWTSCVWIFIFRISVFLEFFHHLVF